MGYVEEKMRCVVFIEGGTGKNVMATALMKDLKRKYTRVYVVSPYWDIFKCCPDVDDAFPPGQPNLYISLIMDNDCEVLALEPYSDNYFIKKQCHLFNAWERIWDLQSIISPADLSDRKPSVEVGLMFPDIVKSAQGYAKKNPKFVIMQFNGGQSPVGQLQQNYNPKNEALKRNYPYAQELVNLFHSKYPDTKIIHFGMENEPKLDNTERPVHPYLYYRELAKYARGIICIDSCLQHFATGVNNNVVVIWGETRPEHFGYQCNKNICARNVKNMQPYFKPLGMSPAVVEFPTPQEVMSVYEHEMGELG